MFTLANKMMCRVDNNSRHGKAGSAMPEIKPRLRVERSHDKGKAFFLKGKALPRVRQGKRSN